MPINNIDLVNIITSFNLLLLFGILFFRRKNSFPNKILAIIMLLSGILNVNNWVFRDGQVTIFPSVIYINLIVILLLAPFIDWYFRLLTGRNYKLKNLFTGLTVLLVLLCLFFWIRFFIISHAERDLIIESVIRHQSIRHITIIKAGFFGLFNLTLVNIIYQYYIFRQRIKENCAEYHSIKQRFINRFVLIIWLLNLTLIVSYLILDNELVDFVIEPVLLNVFYIFIVATGFNQHVIFNKEGYEQHHRKLDSLKPLAEGNGMNISEATVTNLKERVNSLLNEQRIFTDAELNLKKLAKMLNQPEHVVSYFINHHLKTNFFNLVNESRIRLAKEIIQARGKKSEFEVIGYEVGFNSKSSFYRSFKKYTGKTPGDYV